MSKPSNDPLADAFNDLIASRDEPVTRRCTVGKALSEMSEQAAELFRSAMSDSKIRGSKISDTLRANGFDVGQGAVQHHRRKDCRCER